MYDELLGLFISQTEAALEDLTRALAAEDLAKIAGQAHFIKGSAANLRLEEIQAPAKELEFGAKGSKDIAVLQEVAQRLSAAFAQLKQALLTK